MMSKEQLFKLAKDKQYRPEILEKVLKLVQVLQQFMAQPFVGCQKEGIDFIKSIIGDKFMFNKKNMLGCTLGVFTG